MSRPASKKFIKALEKMRETEREEAAALQTALRVVDNAEMAAQLRIDDRELRRSLVRNIFRALAPNAKPRVEEELDGGEFAS